MSDTIAGTVFINLLNSIADKKNPRTKSLINLLSITQIRSGRNGTWAQGPFVKPLLQERRGFSELPQQIVPCAPLVRPWSNSYVATRENTTICLF